MIQSDQATDHQEAPVDGDATSRAVELVLGLPGFVVLAVGEYGGELEVLIETPLTSVACGRCGRPASPHARREHLLRDMPMAGRPAVLVWHKRIWRCRTVECPRQTWSEAASWASLTERAKAWVARRVGAEGESVAAVARSLGLGWTTVMRAVAEIAAPLVEAGERIAAVAAVGVDEHAWQRANARRQTQWATGIVDLSPGRPARLLDVVGGRSGKAYRDWIAAREPAWREGVRIAALDPFRGYRNAVREQLPHAVPVLDAFHVTRLGMQALDEVRRRVQQRTQRPPRPRRQPAV